MQGQYLNFNRNNIPNAEYLTLPNKNSDTSQETDLIQHDLINLLGETTNTLIFCFLDTHVNSKFTRVEIRAAVERHVAELKENGTQEQYLARIQTGKAAVNYWIDRLVETNSLEKKHSKPVLFWRKTRYASKKPSLTQQNMYPWSRGA